jgi:hypothetical protein
VCCVFYLNIVKYRIETWSISDLIKTHEGGNLNLNPPYQRRFIWSLEDQQILIESIANNYPIPNLFLLEKATGKYDMVDGQQRSRTIIGFFNGDFEDFDGNKFQKKLYPAFEKYQISVIVIEKISKDDLSIEEFYGLVNSAGVHLNRPEIKKAEYYDTKFLKLINKCNSYSHFKELGLFTDTVLKRMNDMDFTSELIVLLKDGITDKKEKVDKAFENDIEQKESDELEKKFKKISDSLFVLNKVFPIKRTRYKQRNDFYSLFGFFDSHSLDKEFQTYIYQILVLISGDIFPSNDECPSFQNYARNCVTQSNSKSARQERQNFFEALLLNESKSPNLVQKDVMSFYKMRDIGLKQHKSYFTLDLNHLKTLKPSVSFND